MPLGEAAKATIQVWYGTLDTEQETDAESRLTRLDSAEYVALELLMQLKSDFLRDPTKLRSADDSSDHTENLKQIDAGIARLVSFIEDQGIAGNPAGDALLASAGGTIVGVDVVEVAGTFRFDAGHFRRA